MTTGNCWARRNNMETYDYHNNVWLLKLAIISHPKFRHALPNGNGYRASFVGTCEELLETLQELSENK